MLGRKQGLGLEWAIPRYPQLTSTLQPKEVKRELGVTWSFAEMPMAVSRPVVVVGSKREMLVVVFWTHPQMMDWC
jgi:hypothetical protein